VVERHIATADQDDGGGDRPAGRAEGRRVIAVVGIDRYHAWPRLNNAVSDAKGARRVFFEHGFEEVVPPLLNEAATADAIRGLVTDDLARLHQDTSLVLFFAGHGHTETRNLPAGLVKTGYLIPVDGKRPGGRAASWLPLDHWLNDVARLPIRHILVILDACHSGIALSQETMWRTRGAASSGPLYELRRRQSRRVITSALDHQRAMDSGPIEGHSLFTGCLIEALTEGLARGPQLEVTGSEIGLYVQARVSSYPGSQQTPDFGALKYDDRGELVVSLERQIKAREQAAAREAQVRAAAREQAAVEARAKAAAEAREKAEAEERAEAEAHQRAEVETRAKEAREKAAAEARAQAEARAKAEAWAKEEARVREVRAKNEAEERAEAKARQRAGVEEWAKEVRAKAEARVKVEAEARTKVEAKGVRKNRPWLARMFGSQGRKLRWGVTILAGEVLVIMGAIGYVVAVTQCSSKSGSVAADVKPTQAVRGAEPLQKKAAVVPSLVLPSCRKLAATCGADGKDSCCTSPLVTGGMYYRSHDAAGYDESGGERSKAKVGGFRLDKYEVTVGRFRAFVNADKGTQVSPPAKGDGAHANIKGSGWHPSWNTSLVADKTALVAGVKCFDKYQTWTDSPGGNEALPMNCITWFEAMAFCAWDGGYMPTETEWNYAATGGDEQRAYPWSNPPKSLTLDTTKANYNAGANGVTRVGSALAGDGRWGQSDLVGNVWEWNLDWHKELYEIPCDDCTVLSGGENRVIRGGGINGAEAALRSGYRNLYSPTDRYYLIGVRCARAP
jgi:formylglycine-generating enzyme required for sulfatase activity